VVHEELDMKRLSFLLALVLMTSCGDGSSSGGAPKPGQKKYRFAVVPKMLNNKVFKCAKISAEAAAKEIGQKEGAEIEIVFQGPPESAPARQAQVVESLAGQGVQGISVSVDDVNVLKTAIDNASAKGIPVITFDSDSPGSKRKYFFGTNDIECGERLAKHLGNLIKKGKVVIQSGTTGAPNLQLRVKGAKDYLAKNHPEIAVVDVLYCNDDVKKAVDQIGAYMSAHSDIAGWILVGGWALFGADALKSIDPAKTKVVSCDALPEEWTYLESGKCQMLLAQDLWGWGAQSVRILKDIADGKPVQAGPGGIINGGLEEVTAENLAAFKKKWAEQFPEYK
jgi:ribose transport system substrate-binding protein